MLEPTTAAAIGSGVSSLIQGGADVGAGLFGKKKAYEYNTKMQEQQAKYNREAQWNAFRYNKELSDYAYDRELEQWQRENQANIDFWNMQNAYNSPQAQMERYQAAGLNPNLIYGQSNTSDALSAPSSPSYQANPMQAEQMSGHAGVGDDLRATFGDPIQEYYRVMQMQTQLENAEKQGNVLDSQANLNNMNALFGDARRRFLLSSEPFWDENALFDNMAKSIMNELRGSQVAAMLYKNEHLLPLQKRGFELLNDLRSQNLEFHKDMNPLQINETIERINKIVADTKYTNTREQYSGLKQRFDEIPINFATSGEVSDGLVRRMLMYFLTQLFK